MPVYVKQWIDGDFTLVFARDLPGAVRIFQQTACLNEADILELNAADLSVEFTLSRDGELICQSLTPAVEEARAACYPALVAALGGVAPALVSDQAHQKRIASAVEDEMELRRVAKLSKRLRAEKRQRK
jgi:hypothetical protein